MKRSTGQIIANVQGKWVVRVYLGEDAKGRRRYSSKTITGTKTDARKYLTAQLREKDLGLFQESSSERLNEHLDKWLELVLRHRVSEATFHSYNALLRVHIRPKLGNLKLGSIKPIEIQLLYSSMIETLSARTVRYTHAVLSMAFKQAIKWGTIARNPCADVDLPKNRRKETKAFSPQQANDFLKACQEDENGLIFEFALITGMRPEEYLGLRWSDISFEQSTATVSRALVWKRYGGGFDLLETKTDQSRRTVPLPRVLINKLRHHRVQQSAQKLRLGSSYSNLNLVFTTEFGTPIHYGNLTKRSYQPILKQSELAECGFVLYSLRHSCATLLLAAGVNPKIVSERLGHASIKITLDTYSHVLPNMQQEATDQLEAMLYRKQ